MAQKIYAKVVQIFYYNKICIFHLHEISIKLTCAEIFVFRFV